MARSSACRRNSAKTFSKPFLQQLELGGQALRLHIQTIAIRSADELDAAFAAMTKNAAEAVVVQPSLPRIRIAELALKNRILAIAPTAAFPTMVTGLCAGHK